MSVLTNAAIEGYRQYTKRTVSYARYKLGNTYYRANIGSVITNAGIVEINFEIVPAIAGTISEIQLYDRAGALWFSKTENIVVSSIVEGFWYSVQVNIKEKEEN